MPVLRRLDVTATVVSAMVGAGIFLAPSKLLQQGASPATILVLFALAGVVAVAGAMTLAELAARRPGNGGPFRYIQAAFGDGPAFLFGWSRFWVMQTGALAILSLTTVRFTAAGLGLRSSYWEAVVAILLLAATTGLNARGLRLGAHVQIGMTALKIGALLALAVGVLLAAPRAALTEPAPATLPGGLGSWLLLTVFAFGGWTQVTFLAGEQKEPRRLAGPLLAGVLAATAIYLIALTAMFIALPDGSPADLIAADAAGALWGESGRRIVSFVIAIAVLGGLHTMTLTGPRLYAAAADEGAWWHPFARLNVHGAPARGLWLQAEWAALLVALSLLANDAFVVLIGSISTAIWMFHVVTAASWFRLRREGSADFATPGRGWTAGLFLIATATVIALAVAQDLGAMQEGRWRDLTSLWALLLIGSGVVAWRLRRPFVRRSRS